MKIFSSLPNNIENLRNDRVQFKLVLTEYLISHSFYSLTEFLNIIKVVHRIGVLNFNVY